MGLIPCHAPCREAEGRAVTPHPAPPPPATSICGLLSPPHTHPDPCNNRRRRCSPPPLRTRTAASWDMGKHLSSVADSVLQRCAETVDTTADELVAEFELGLEPAVENDYSRKLVEYCSSRALIGKLRGGDAGDKIADGSFSRFTFDMMLAWETPSASDEESHSEGMSKEKEDRREPLKGKEGQAHDDIPLFYSDIMPLLVDEELNVGEDAFVWLATQFPLIADVANARFSFETFTASTANRLHFPGYDKYLKEIDQCVKYLQKQSKPTGVALADDEFILHVEGTVRTQRVVRHVGASSWPGRLTLTNRALYFEASGVISYENAVKIDLSKPGVDHQVRSRSTGPFGAPIFDKAIVYESSELPEGIILEFPEMTSSTRRDHWLALTKEIILLHQFLSKFNIEFPIQAWEMQARSVLGIIRLHAAREMLRIAPPAPGSFLIFALFDELPKGDYVLEELANSLKETNGVYPCSAASILKSLSISHPSIPNLDVKEGSEIPMEKPESLESLETTISQVREEAKEVGAARSTVEDLKEEGTIDAIIVLVELLRPLKDALPRIQGVLNWERPMLTLAVLTVALVITYKEWIGYAIAASLLWGVGIMVWARHRRVGDEHMEIVVTSFGQTTVESLVNAQHGYRDLHTLIQKANITILKLWSILVSRAQKQANEVMGVMAGLAIFFCLVPFKFVMMALIVCTFQPNLGGDKSASRERVRRRLREWWDSIPIIPVRIV
ncbi:hypothetical protein Taro_006987 [Colocasia esculenta]|uniref:Uncharacterized protein n=1 Tax=Colocasia esculenta TaxID=4460 RepID=A0A843TYZ7_COLES|nr:hypothetical protein [Colocasia esculenta]